MTNLTCLFPPEEQTLPPFVPSPLPAL